VSAPGNASTFSPLKLGGLPPPHRLHPTSGLISDLIFCEVSIGFIDQIGKAPIAITVSRTTPAGFGLSPRSGRQTARRLAMIRKSIPFGALILSACVSQAAYNEEAAQLEQARAEVAAQEAQIAAMQARSKWVMAGDLLFPPAATS